MKKVCVGDWRETKVLPSLHLPLTEIPLGPL